MWKSMKNCAQKWCQKLCAFCVRPLEHLESGNSMFCKPFCLVIPSFHYKIELHYSILWPGPLVWLDKKQGFPKLVGVVSFGEGNELIKLFSTKIILYYSWLPNITTKRKEPHACTIGWNIDTNKSQASPGLYSSNAFVVIKALPISSSKSHIVLNKPHASFFGQCIEMNT